MISMETDVNLTKREKEILQLVCNANCRKTIAKKLNISLHTVDSHLRNLHLKTKTHSLTELIIWTLNNLSLNIH